MNTRPLELKRLAPVLATTAVAFAPSAALACAVCAGGNPANRFTIFASTIVLSLLPLGLFAGGLLWLRAKLRERGADEFVERDVTATAVRPVREEVQLPPAVDIQLQSPPA